MKFTKMHGIGNDYIYINTFEEPVEKPGELARVMSDRHFGVGSDGLILITPSEKADFRMRMFNPDGSEAEMCGNGIRCVAKYVYDGGMTKKEEITIETGAGVLTLRLLANKGKIEKVKVDMGIPRLEREEIPMKGSPGRVISEKFEVNERLFSITCVSMGNPHCIIFLNEPVKTFPVEVYGPLIERHPLFPRRTNVEFVEVLNRHEIRFRTWERGAGETLACGTGASAVTVASVLNNKTDRAILTHLLGGDLEMEWGEDEHVYMTGPAVEVFTGEWRF
ncbi:MAG: diaminopimelate epimerase [Candidatus Tectomicrobia bacterium]|nr:diaminopimelate epimerase [Candidatus Tectomicrobia bacterium]